MSTPTDTQPCGHNVHYIVIVEEGRAGCAICEREALREEADRLESRAAYLRKQADRLTVWIGSQLPEAA